MNLGIHLCGCRPHNISSTLTERLNLHFSAADKIWAGAVVSTLEASRLPVRSRVQAAEGCCISQSYLWDLSDNTLASCYDFRVLFVPLPPNCSETLAESLGLVCRFIFLENKAVCSGNTHVKEERLSSPGCTSNSIPKAWLSNTD